MVVMRDLLCCFALFGIGYGQIANYKHNSLTSIPDDIPLETTELYLTNNQISSVREDAFTNLTDLVKLYIPQNLLTSLPERLFTNNIQLQVLSLSDNKLTSVPAGLLTGLTNLHTLDIKSNQLDSIPESFFEGLISLTSVSLYKNKLTSFNAQHLSNLTELSLDLRTNPFIEKICTMSCTFAMLKKAETNGVTVKLFPSESSPPECWTSDEDESNPIRCPQYVNDTNVDTDVCTSSPCQNGGSCVDGINIYTCNCAPGYMGDHCQTDIDECTSSPCQNGGSCVDRINIYTCNCAPGYTGDHCQNETDDCISSPCENGGSCVDGINQYTCNCVLGYTGDKCLTDIDDCISSPCENGGSCVDGINQYACNCSPGYMGDHCQNDIDECLSSPCQNGGSCVDGINQYACNCSPGYTGDKCLTVIDECINSPCENGGSCIDGINNYTCICSPGYTGDHCQTDIDECGSMPCRNGGNCVDAINSYICSCVQGYNGHLCQNDIDHCISGPCQNGGSCVDGIHNFTCNCVPGYTGDLCQNDNRSLDVNYSNCEDLIFNATLFDSLPSESSCGEDHEDLLFVNIGNCTSFPCGFLDNCNNSVDNNTSNCGPNYNGTDCGPQSNGTDGITAGSNFTTNHSDVEWACRDAVDNCSLLCEAPLTRSDATKNETSTLFVNVDICNTFPYFIGDCCGPDSNGTCCLVDADDNCTSKQSVIRWVCEDVSDNDTYHCTVQFSGPACLTDQQLNKSAVLFVDGDYCPTFDNQTDADNCTSKQSVIRWVCEDVSDNDTYHCTAQCSGPACLTDQLLNKSTVLFVDGDYCPTFDNQTDADNCTSSQSVIRWVCEDVSDNDTYHCTAQCSGPACLTDQLLNKSAVLFVDGDYCPTFNNRTDVYDCASGPCLNGGRCEDSNNGYSCRCETGYTGQHCESDIDECASSPCRNGGSCNDMINEYFCNCTRGYIGHDCDEVITCSEPQTVQNAVSVSHKHLADKRFVFDSTHKYRCHPGYKLGDGSDFLIILCGLNGDWMNSQPDCTKYLCPAPPLFEHIEFASLNRRDGGEVKYRCKDGYAFQTNEEIATITCRSLIWDSYPPPCVEIRCPGLQIQHAIFEDDNNGTALAGSYVTVRCTLGYEFSDGTNIRSFVCLGEGQWHADIHQCRPIACPDQPNDSDRRDVYNDTPPPGRLTSVCNNNKHLYKCLVSNTVECSHRRKWNRDIGLCESIPCPVVPWLNNSHYERHGEIVTYTCITGYRFADGNKTKFVNCVDAIDIMGRNLHVCLEVTCPPIPSVNHASPNTTLALYGTVVKYTCDNGYWFAYQNYSVVTKCTDNGEWIMPQIDDCTVIVCDAMSHYENVNISNYSVTVFTRVTMSCNKPGTRFIDGKKSKNVKCLVSGLWSEIVSDCSDDRCTTVQNIRNAHPDTVITTYGTTVTYQCVDGYEFPDNTSTDSITCNNGDWNETLDDCTVIHCPHASVQNAHPDHFGTRFNTKRSYTCHEGHLLPDLQDRMTMKCLANKTWSNSELGCISINCSVLLTETNMLPNTTKYHYGTEATLFCRQTYHFPGEGAFRKIRCTANGTWSLKVEDCTMIHCPPIPVWENMLVNTSDTASNTTVNYTCADGFYFAEYPELVSQSSTCDPFGAWYPSLYRCKDNDTSVVVVPPAEAQNADKIGVVVCGACGVVLFLCLLLDITTFVKQLKFMKQNISSRFSARRITRIRVAPTEDIELI